MPTMATVCPALISALRKMFMAQPSGSPGNGLPASAGGSFTTAASSATSYSAKLLCDRAATRSPTATPVTPSPKASTTPQPS